MNKNELIASIASEAGLTKADAGKALDAFISSITTALKGGDEVRLVGFGTFAPAERPARTGKNPRTGEVLEIPAKTIVKFKPGSDLALNRDILS